MTQQEGELVRTHWVRALHLLALPARQMMVRVTSLNRLGTSTLRCGDGAAKDTHERGLPEPPQKVARARDKGVEAKGRIQGGGPLFWGVDAQLI